MKYIPELLLSTVICLTLAGCDRNTPIASNASTQEKRITKARVNLQPTKDSVVRGVVTFTEMPEGIKIVADIDG
jgi:hypothetical protein